MIQSPYIAALQSAHMYQGKTNDCGPFSFAIVVNTLTDADISGEMLSEQLEKLRWKGILPIIRKIPNWATFPWAVMDVFQPRNIRSSWKILCRPPELKKGLIEDKIQIVIIGRIIPSWAHYKILVAHDEDNGWGFVDPAQSEPSVFWEDDLSFTRKWNNLGRILISVSPNE